MFKRIGYVIACIVACQVSYGQLKAGFDKAEYMNLMRVSAQFGAAAYSATYAPVKGYQKTYESPTVGMDNTWQLWKDDKGNAVISVRGTTQNGVSWLENFYAAMIPAKGELQLTKDYRFHYDLAVNPRAAVHVGWTVALGFLARDMMPKIDSAYKAGTRSFLIIGHSQGGAIVYLLNAYLHRLQALNQLAKDIRIKTYCSAAPKPGNVYFAYEYEATMQGWAFNVINSLDWVPQTPFSVQGLNDFNEVNPFVNAKPLIKKQGWPKRWALNYAYRKMKKPAKKALKIYQKFLGRYVSKSVKKSLNGFETPDYFASNDYVRTGATIVLWPDESYYKEYPQDVNKPFVNHLHGPYLMLANKLAADGSMTANSGNTLDGDWQVIQINAGDLFENVNDAGKKPFMSFDIFNHKVSGNTSCNNFSGSFVLEGNKLSVSNNLMLTKMYCEGSVEQLFIQKLKTVDSYSIANNELTLLSDGKMVMVLGRR